MSTIVAIVSRSIGRPFGDSQIRGFINPETWYLLQHKIIEQHENILHLSE